MTESELLETVREVLRTEFDLPQERLRPDARLQEDLDLDSLDAVVLAARLEEETGLVIDDDLVRSVRTLQDILDALGQRLHRRSA